MSKQLDPIGQFLATLHAVIGHDATARFLGTDSGDKTQCILCLYDASKATRAQVIAGIGVETQRRSDRDG